MQDSGTMKTTLEIINEMQAKGVIGKYAIGGAVGATFYLEPAATLDVDIFVVLPNRIGSSLVTLTPIYDYLTGRGCRTEGEHIMVGTWPVQFLPASDALEKEALDDAVPTEVDGVKTWVMTAEHLVAIALRTGLSLIHICAGGGVRWNARRNRAVANPARGGRVQSGGAPPGVCSHGPRSGVLQRFQGHEC